MEVLTENAMELTLSEILFAVDGELARGEGDCMLQGISTDTRTLRAGDVFFALEGERFDGHSYVPQAEKKKAAAVVVSRIPEDRENEDVPLILVSDTLKALGDTAAFYRRKFQPVVIGITGSVGKTTSKEMLAHLLRGRGKVVAPPGSFNNFIGVPLTLFNLDEETAFAVLELGTNAPGEIQRLSEITGPDIALITNIGPAHLEGLGDVRGVAREKGDLVKALRSNGKAVLNGDDPLAREFASFNRGESYFYGLGENVDFCAEQVTMQKGKIRFALNGKIPVRLPFRGEHNLYNALGAMSVARLLGMEWEEMEKSLSSFSFPSMRLEERRVKGILWIHDAYNANPLSVKAALLDLVQRTGRKVAILGNMRELGPKSSSYHREAGTFAAQQGIDLLWAVGEGTRDYLDGAREAGMPEERLVLSSGIPEVLEKIPGLLKEGDCVLVKASRAVGLDRVIPPVEEEV